MCSLQQVAFLNWLSVLPKGRYKGLDMEAVVDCGRVLLAFWDADDVVILEDCQILTDELCA
jgi:hypothetical protein